MRLVTFNIMHGRSLADGRVDVVRYATAIHSLDADLLTLQEVDRDQPRSQGADLTAIAAEAMGAVEHRFVPALSGTPGGTWVTATDDHQPGAASYGVALLSRYPVRSWQSLRLPALPVPVPVPVPNRRAPILTRDEPRVAVAAVVATPYGEITVATTHLSFVPAWNLLQLRRVLSVLDDARRPLILMGDLNMNANWAVRVTGMRPLATAATFPAKAPRRQLDHILAHGALPLPKHSAASRLPLSDHLALCLDL